MKTDKSNIRTTLHNGEKGTDETETKTKPTRHLIEIEAQ